MLPRAWSRDTTGQALLCIQIDPMAAILIVWVPQFIYSLFVCLCHLRCPASGIGGKGLKQRSSYSSRHLFDKSYSSYRINHTGQTADGFQGYRLNTEAGEQTSQTPAAAGRRDAGPGAPLDVRSGKQRLYQDEDVETGSAGEEHASDSGETETSTLVDEVAEAVTAAEQAPSVAAQKPDFDPHLLWQTLLGELKMQLDAARFNTWMRDTRVIAYEDGEFIIGSPHAYARDWLDNRMRTPIQAHAALAGKAQR